MGPVTEAAATRERITYLIASYNQSRYVRDCLASLLAQTSGSWLAVLVDDASTDDSLAVIRTVEDPRIRVLRNPRNLGYIGTLQRLIAEATTDIVGVLDADDALAPEATARLLAAYAAGADVGFVYSCFGSFDERLEECRAVHGGVVPAAGTALLDGPVGAIRSFRRSVYGRTAGLDASMLYAEDRDLIYKLEEVTRPVFVDALLYRYREVEGSQARHAVKREVGLRNTLRARRAALRRRGVRGVLRPAWELWAYADFRAASEHTPALLKPLARGLAAAAARLVRSRPHFKARDFQPRA